MRGIRYYTYREVCSGLNFSKQALIYQLEKQNIKPLQIGKYHLISAHQIGLLLPHLPGIPKETLNHLYLPKFYNKTMLHYIKENCFTVMETAQILTISRQAVLKKVKSEKIPSYKIDKLTGYFIPIDKEKEEIKNSEKKKCHKIPRDFKFLEKIIYTCKNLEKIKEEKYVNNLLKKIENYCKNFGINYSNRNRNQILKTQNKNKSLINSMPLGVYVNPAARKLDLRDKLPYLSNEELEVLKELTREEIALLLTLKEEDKEAIIKYSKED